MQHWKNEELLQMFYRISGLKIVLFDSRFHCIAIAGTRGGYCSFLHRSKRCLDVCMQSDMEGFRQAKRRGEAFIYKCPFGLYEAISPITLGEETVGYLIIGPAAEPGEATERELIELARAQNPDWSEELLRRHMETLVRYAESDFSAFCDTLTVFAAYFENGEQLINSEKTIGQLVKSYVKRNLTKKITLAELSLHTHCSTVTLTEHFRREFGITIMQYVLQKRMQLAEQMLLETTCSVTDISQQCGFSDVEYFSRCFKQTHDLPPSEWRLRGAEGK